MVYLDTLCFGVFVHQQNEKCTHRLWKRPVSVIAGEYESADMAVSCGKRGCHGLEADGLDVEVGWTIGELDADAGVTERNADSIFKYPETSRTCVCWTRTCREASQAPWRTWSCRWSTPPPVRRY